jgi:hypothetical protein
MRPDMNEPAVSLMRAWSLAGADRLMGFVWDVAGQTDRRILTTRVVQVLFEGVPPMPVAVTASGTQYRLGPPGDRLSNEAAVEFLKKKRSPPSPPSRPSAEPGFQTTYR